MRYLKIITFIALIAIVIGIGLAHDRDSGVVKEGETIYITDRTGERWDITQAVSLGFQPNGFQFGLGRHAIVPLDASHLTRDPALTMPDDQRIIGVQNSVDAHAYVVRKLTRHEVANTALGDTPIAAAY